MFAKHVSNLASAYCHDELSPKQSRRVAEHLISCRDCRGEFEEVKFGARLAAQLPLIRRLCRDEEFFQSGFSRGLLWFPWL